MKVKICGLSTPKDVSTAIEAGADLVGFVFFPKSPRNISLERASSLSSLVPSNVKKVVLVVNPEDFFLEKIMTAVDPDMIQLHGHEKVSRVSEIRDLFNLPIMKAVGIRNRNDLGVLNEYSHVADQLLVDAKPVETNSLPGGNGIAFDWKLISEFDWELPWMLAGGLNSSNVATAVKLTNAKQVDVSSGVEKSPGIKDPEAIRKFITAAKANDNGPESD